MKKKFLILCIPIFLLADEQPLPIGNFSVPMVTMIAPLVSFGQHIIGKALLSELSGAYQRGHQESYSLEIAPNFIYGARDDLAITFYFPFYPRQKMDGSHSSGIGDIFLQAEYAYYSGSWIDHTLQGTIVASLNFPTGSSSKNPPTGAGWFSYFLGTTFAYMSYNWYVFASPGANLTILHNGMKNGNEYLYEVGFARYIDQLSPPGWIFDLMFEFDGTYSSKDKTDGQTDPNSGGNVIFFTPSIWMSSKYVELQLGVGFPIYQNLNGSQTKMMYSIDYNLGVGIQF